MSTSALNENARQEPYWWRAAPRPVEPAKELPATCDVAIVGSGYTGLSAALHLARAGKSVAVLEAKEPGWGASSRNAGYVGRTLKHMFGDIMEREGLERTVRVYRELHQAFDFVFETVSEERIDCRLKRQGRYIMAATQGQYDHLAKEFALRKKHLGEDFHMVGKSDQPAEINTERYFGGTVVPDHGGLHPGLYHLGLLKAAERAGATVYGHTPVIRIKPGEGLIRVKTARGAVAAKNAIIATNGYSGPAIPWIQRRVIPFDAYMVATEPLPEEEVSRLLPGDRTFIDWNFNVDYVRKAPDDPRRILFGGLTGERNADLPSKAGALRARLARIFPSLAGVRFDNVWTGRCSGTLDLDPHWGTHEGVHYALGYCFAGVPMGTWFGLKVANDILGRKEPSVFADRPLPSHPLYRGNAWFAPMALKWLARKDG